MRVIVERFTDLELDGGKWYADGWVSYEEELNSVFDIWDCDFSLVDKDNYRCPLIGDEQAILIVQALGEIPENERDIE